MNPVDKKGLAVALRKKGKTYDEIMVGLSVPKSTLSFWLKDLVLPKFAQVRLLERKKKHNVTARKMANAGRQRTREAYFSRLSDANQHLTGLLECPDTAKIVLAALYLGEGSKQRSSVTFGNSNPKIITLFLRLLRQCYTIREDRFRCTVQCRADQNQKSLERFWSRVTGISRERFYKTRIDPRTIGKPSRKLEYKGVCRIDYFSADVFNDVAAAIDAITAGR